PLNADKVSSLTEWGGANLEHRYALNCAEQRPTELNFTAATCEFYISAAPAVVRTSLGVKGSQVQILSSRRRDRAVSLSEMPPDLCPDAMKGAGPPLLVIPGSCSGCPHHRFEEAPRERTLRRSSDCWD